MKKLALLVSVFFLSTNAFALIEVGDTVANRCWKTVEEKTLCLDDMKNSVRVLIYSTGWCPDCNDEFKVLIPRMEKEIVGMNVHFISLSASGWKRPNPPDTQFLKEWKARHKIPFTVAASPKDAGNDFFEETYVPNFVIVGKDSRLKFKSYSSSQDQIFEVIKKLAAE